MVFFRSFSKYLLPGGKLSIKTTLQAGYPGNRGLIWGRGRDISCCTQPWSKPGAYTAFYAMSYGGNSHEKRWPGCNAAYLHQPSVEVKN
jgi:hypothetical protein